MPTPKKNESEKDYMSRCISTLMHEGKPQKQAIAICYSMFREAKRGKGKKDVSPTYLKAIEKGVIKV